jgi:integrase
MRIIRRYAKKAGVQPIQGKELRHSHVSYLINELNADVLTISRRLGHSGPDITLKYYAHMWNRNDEGLINDMANGIDIDNSQAKPLDFSGNQFLRMNSYNSPTI